MPSGNKPSSGIKVHWPIFMSPYGASRPQWVNYFVAKPGMPLKKLGSTMSSPGICAIDRSLYLMKDSNHLSLPKCNEMMETHYNDVIMSAMASQITGVFIVNSTVGSGADQRKHQSSASLAFVRGIHRWPVKVTRKMFPLDDFIMCKCDFYLCPQVHLAHHGLFGPH